jgi:hypothetical protein
VLEIFNAWFIYIEFSHNSNISFIRRAMSTNARYRTERIFARFPLSRTILVNVHENFDIWRDTLYASAPKRKKSDVQPSEWKSIAVAPFFGRSLSRRNSIFNQSASCVSSIVISILFHSAESLKQQGGDGFCERTWEELFHGLMQFRVSVVIQCRSDLCDWSNGKRASSIMQTIGLRFMSLLWFLLAVMRISVVSGMSSEKTLLLLLR